MLRPARDTDSGDVLRWRNHPDVRAVSLNQHVITEDEHAAWWTATASDPSRRLLVYERDGVPSGVVSFFDLDLELEGEGAGARRSAQWGFYLDVVGLDERGQTLLAWLELQREAVRYAFDELGVTVLEGEVLATNEAVRQMNRRLKFVEVETVTRVVDGMLAEVIRVRREATSPARG